MIQESAPNTSSVLISIVQGAVYLGAIALSHWMASRKVRDIKDINVAQSSKLVDQSSKLDTVERLVNGDRLKMKLHNAALEAQVRAAGLTPELPPE